MPQAIQHGPACFQWNSLADYLHNLALERSFRRQLSNLVCTLLSIAYREHLRYFDYA